MKKLITLAIVLMLTLASVTSGAARGGALQLYGTIDSIDYNALTFVMVVTSPDHYAGKITVQITSETFLKQCDGDQISFYDLEVGNSVRVMGVFVDGNLVATKVIQNPENVPD